MAEKTQYRVGIFREGSPAERAQRILDILDVVDATDAIMAHEESATEAGEADAEIFRGYARAINDLQCAARDQALSGVERVPERLMPARCLEEALVMISAAVRDNEPYGQATPDWSRPFMSTLPHDGSFRQADHAAENRPLPPAPGRSLPMDGGSLIWNNAAHWLVDREGLVRCGPGHSAARITPPEMAGNGFGAVHCAVERLINISSTRSQPSLTPSGYKSRSRSWDLIAAEADMLGIQPHPKGDVPDFAHLEDVLNADGLTPQV